MWNLKIGKRQTEQEGNDFIRPAVGRQPDRFRKWTGLLGKTVSEWLERIDAGLSNRQRKWLFCLGLLCWSSFLFYLLGMAVRTPPARFVLPFAAETGQAGPNRPK